MVEEAQEGKHDGEEVVEWGQKMSVIKLLLKVYQLSWEISRRQQHVQARRSEPIGGSVLYF